MTRSVAIPSKASFQLGGVMGLWILSAVAAASLPGPRPATVESFDSYVRAVETRLADQHRNPEGFLTTSAQEAHGARQLQDGELIVERITPAAGADLPGALLHHWRGTAFARGASARDFELLLRDFNNYPRYFAPQVVEAGLLSHPAGKLEDQVLARLRVRQQHLITVVMDTTYEVSFGRLDAQHGWSTARSREIREIQEPGTAKERALPAGEEHGYLWRINTYWSWEERDGGLYLQMESVSLTRSIPRGLGWAVAPLVEGVPRESLEFTLRSACHALDK
jgi:hypothetical protein